MNTLDPTARTLTGDAPDVKRLDLTGQRFDALTVVEPAPNSVSCRHHAAGLTRWRCRCDCGGEAIVATKELRQGRTRSCGCRRVSAGRAVQAKLRAARRALS